MLEAIHPELYLRLYDTDAKARIQLLHPTSLPFRRTSPRGISTHDTRSTITSEETVDTPGALLNPERKPRPPNCKTPLFQFSHGGHKRVTKGKRQNQVNIAAPCLQTTCRTCQRWHPHLIKAVEQSQKGSPDAGTHTRIRGEEGALREHEDQSLALDLMALSHSPATVCQQGTQRVEGKTGSETKDILAQNILAASSQTKCESEPSMLCIVDLATQEKSSTVESIGNKGPVLRGILKTGNSSKRKRYESGELVGQYPSTQLGMVKKVRFRHVVRLVFSSGRGRLMFKSAVERLTQKGE
ncbi:hypothetical protein P154DRAFT_603261 [Amniculicola lignicola CBS 123094]|uniref:Uncharacterized protein n=1 Tax=Amniculicola lignicola CBS 123094 TaxID=1392246 RepID=A0A6A5WBV0_9PLEO|nr:hypothetical protein P154DRAFT_603261 [Amniculicola lignicola CBS 123094]